MAAAAFGDLPAPAELLEGQDEIDCDAEPDYSTSEAVHREIVPPGSPVTRTFLRPLQDDL